MGGATFTFEGAHKHLLFGEDNGNTGPVAIAVSDDMCFGKRVPII